MFNPPGLNCHLNIAGETLNIVIKNCNNVQIGENAALLTSKRDQEALR